MVNGWPLLVVVLLLSACTEPPAPVQPPVEEPPTVEASEPSASVALADAMLAEMASREAQFKKLERELQQRPAAIPDERARMVAAPSRAPGATPPAPAEAPAAAPAAAPGKDEAWWKDRARAIGIRLDEAERMSAASAAAVTRATLRITQDEARAEYLTRVAALNTIRAELASLQEDARRANVPPGWLRWP